MNSLESLQNNEYRGALQEIFEVGRGPRLRFEWGSLTTSIRVATPDRTEPVTIAWLFPPGRPGRIGLTDLTLGFDPASADQAPSVRPLFDQYVERIEPLPDVEPAKSQFLRAYKLSPPVVVNLKSQIIEALADLVGRISEEN